MARLTPTRHPQLQAIRQQLPPLLRLAIPLIFAELGWMFMAVIDTVMVGRLPNSALPLSAVAISDVAYNTIVFGTAGIMLGLDTLISQAFGAREIDEANQWFRHGLVLAFGLALALLALFTLAPPLMHLLPTSPQIVNLAIPTLRGLGYGTIPLLLYFALRRYLQAAHHARPIAFALVSANIVNAALDWLLIYGHHWGNLNIPAFGVVGSSWATSLARLYMMLVLAVSLWVLDRRHSYGVRSSLRAGIEFQHIARLFKLGAPAGASIFVEIAIFALVTGIISTFGAQQLAGHDITLLCASFTFMVPFAISSATAVQVGHAIGRIRANLGTAAEAAAAGWAGVLSGGTIMLIAALILLAAPATIARIFTPDETVIAAAVPLLYVAAGFQFFDGLQINLGGALRGAGNTTTPLLSQLFCFWLIGMPTGIYLGFHRHLAATGLWLGLLTALTLHALAMLAVWTHTTRRLTSSQMAL